MKLIFAGLLAALGLLATPSPAEAYGYPCVFYRWNLPVSTSGWQWICNPTGSGPVDQADCGTRHYQRILGPHEFEVCAEL